MAKLKLGRRAFLSGVGGVMVGLPLLDAMLDQNGVAYADGGAIPSRYLQVFGGFGMGQGNVPQRIGLEPSAEGPGYPVPSGLQPLLAHGIHDRVTVVTNLTVPTQTAKDFQTPIPAGGRTVGFHFHGNPMISGNRSLQDPNGPLTYFDATVTGPSSDQVMAAAVGQDTTHRYLSYRAQALFYSSGQGVDKRNNRDTLSFDMNGTAVQPEVSPKLAYGSLFTGFTPDDPAEAAKLALALEKRKSVLDLVDRRMAGLIPRLGARDQQRIEQHFAEIRALEERLHAAPPQQSGECQLIDAFGDDPDLGGEPSSPTDYDVNNGYSGEDIRARRLADLIHMAFTCDLTRVAAYMLSMWQSYLNIHPITGQLSNMHQMNHGKSGGVTFTLQDLEDVAVWHIDHFAYLVSKLAATPEGAGSVLDNCAITFMCEGGHGYGHEGGEQYSSHSTENMVMLVAGGAGGLKQGHHIVAQNGQNHVMQVIISAMQAAGYTGNSMGEVSGNVPALFA